MGLDDSRYQAEEMHSSTKHQAAGPGGCQDTRENGIPPEAWGSVSRLPARADLDMTRHSSRARSRARSLATMVQDSWHRGVMNMEQTIV